MKKKIWIPIVSVAAAALVAAGLIVFLPKLTKPAEQESTTAEPETEALPTLVNVTDIDWFDPNADEIVIENADMLKDLIELSYHYDFEGKTVKLAADITLNEGDAADWENEAPAVKWSPIIDFAGTFDGQGHTISGIYMKTYNAPTAMFTNAKNTAVVRNFRIENSLILTNGALGSASVMAASSGTVQRVYSNAVIRCVYGRAGGIVSAQSGNMTVEECWFDGLVENTWRNIGGIADCADGAEMVINHCLNTGKIIGTWKIGADNAGGIAGMSLNGGRLMINDCFASGEIEVANLNRSGTVLGGTDASSSVAFTKTFAVAERFSAPVSNYVSNDIGGAIPIPEEELLGVGAYQWTKLDFDEHWVCLEDALPGLKCFNGAGLSLDGVERKVDYDWYDENASEYIITNEAELLAFAFSSYETDFAEKSVKLAADITLNEGAAREWIDEAPEKRWYPVRSFAGTFDGQGHTISGLYVPGNTTLGMFARTKSTAYLKDFRLVNSLIKAETKGEAALSGGIVGRGAGTLDGIYTDAIVWADNLEIGGFIGQVNVAGVITNIANCWFDGEVIAVGEVNGYTVGGFVGGHVLGTLNISNCLATGVLHCEVNKGSRAGGIVGTIMNQTVLAINNCISDCTYDVLNHYYLASMVGVAYNNTKTTIRNSYGIRESVENASGEYVSQVKATNSNAAYAGGAAPVLRANMLGAEASRWTELNFERYWALRDGDIPVPKKFYDGEPIAAAETKAYNTDWYEKGTGGTIQTVEDYLGFMMLSWTTDFAGETITLGKDITFNNGTASSWTSKAPAVRLIPLNDFAGTFDGRYHVLSGVYQKEPAVLGLFARTTAKSTVRNLIVINSLYDVTGYPDASGLMSISGTVAGRGGGTFSNIYSGAILVTRGYNTGGIVGQVFTNSDNVFSDLWFNGSIYAIGPESGFWAGGIAGSVNTGNNRFEHCLFTGKLSTEVSNKGSKVGGIIGSIQGTAIVRISDTLSAGTIDCGNPYYKAAVVGVVYSNTLTTLVNCYADNKSALGDIGQFIGVAKNAQLKEHELSGNVIALPKENLTGVRAYQYTALDFKSHYAARENNYPGLMRFVGAPLSVAGVEKVVDTSWYNANAKEFTIRTAAELLGLTALTAGDDFAGKTVKLGADIDVNPGWTAGETAPDIVWPMISTFAGTFDGQGHTISGIYVSADSGDNIGFISVLKGGTIRNLKYTNSYIRGGEKTNGVGGLVGAVNGGGLIDTVYSSADIVHQYYNNGGLVGRVINAGTLKIVNSEFSGTVTGVGYASGGLVGGVVHDTSALEVENCLSNGLISTELMRSEGGFVGNRYNQAQITVRNSLFSGRVQSGGGGQTFAVVGQNNNGVLTLDHVYATTESSAAGAPGYNTGSSKGSLILYAKSFISGADGYRNTELDFTEKPYWVAVPGNTPQLAAFHEGETVDISNVSRPDNSWYDPEASEYVIETPEQLLAWMTLTKTETFAGKTVKLGADIDLNPSWSAGETAPELVWAMAGTFEGTLDGQGHSVSGVYVKAENGDSIGFISVLQGGTIRNFTLKNSYIEGGESSYGVGGIVGTVNQGGLIDTVSSSAIVKHYSFYNGGLVGRATNEGTLTITNSRFDGTVTGTGFVNAGLIGAGIHDTTVVSISHCLVTGLITTDMMRTEGGLVGSRVNGSTLTISDTLFSGRVQSGGGGQTFAVIGQLHGGSMTLDHVYVTKEGCDAGAPGYFNGTTDGQVVLLNQAKLTGIGGYQRTDLDFDTYWAAVEDGTPELRAFFDGTPLSTEGVEKISADVYDIASVEDLLAFAAESKTNDFTGETIILSADLDLSEVENFPMIGPDTSKGWAWFKGVFDGKNHTIKNLKISSNEYAVGFFRTTNGATIKNLTLDGVTVESTSDSATVRVGALVGNSHTGGGTVENVTIRNASVKAAGVQVGGVIGSSMGEITLNQVSYSGTVTAKSEVGGIIGTIANKKVIVRGAFVDADLTGTAGSGSEANVGGVIGRSNAGADVQNVTVKGKIHTNEGHTLGGVIGRAASTTTVEKADVTAELTFPSGTYGRVGGVIGAGWAAGMITVRESRFGGQILAGVAGIQIAGIVGITMNNNTVLVIENCLTDGSVVNTGMSAVGGIYGHTNNQTAGNVTITKCLVTGTVSSAGGGSTGAVIGTSTGRPITVSDTYYDAASCAVGSNGVGLVGANLTNSATSLTKDQLTGEAAKENAAALDFESVWMTREGDTPYLRALAGE